MATEFKRGAKGQESGIYRVTHDTYQTSEPVPE
jgi:hypothetical protein